ncbi:MAG TPA: hypothetical protein DCK87_06055 [Desulfotomaculum sp.]|nr:hypothetical protein [Desulfotomaculum sp.]
MLNTEALTSELRNVFEEKQALAIVKVVTKAVAESQQELVKAKDFNELKEIIKQIGEKINELAGAQQGTEKRVGELANAQQETEKRVGKLAEIAQRTEERMEELARAQQKTEERMEELAQAIKSLTEVEKDTREQLGGLSKSMGYALENEAFRFLPVYFQNLGLEITEKFIRTEIDGEEINLFARGRKNGKEVIIVGESDLRLTKAWKKIEQIERKVAVVQKNFPDAEIVKVLVTHYAKPAVAEKIKEKGIILLPSYEWI